MNTGDFRWHCDVVIQSVFLFAVPVFFMISGANLIGYRTRHTTKEFFRRRFKRVCITLMGYSALYYLLGCFFPLTFGQPAREPSVFAFLEGLFTNSICDVFWFLYAVLALYAVTPLLSKMADDKRLFGFITALSIVSTVVVPMLNRFAPNHRLFDLASVQYLSGWIMYYLLGYYLVHFMQREVKVPILAPIAGVSVAITAIMTLRTNSSHTVLSGNFAEFDSFYLSSLGLFVSIYSVCVFLLFKKAEGRLSRLGDTGRKRIQYLSSLAFGIYAVHMLVINTLDMYIEHNIVWDIVIRPFVVFFIALVVSAAVNMASHTLRTAWARRQSLSDR